MLTKLLILVFSGATLVLSNDIAEKEVFQDVEEVHRFIFNIKLDGLIGKIIETIKKIPNEVRDKFEFLLECADQLNELKRIFLTNVKMTKDHSFILLDRIQKNIIDAIKKKKEEIVSKIGKIPEKLNNMLDGILNSTISPLIPPKN